jgi:4-diphosphocytidyl-2-C-methyl-D-erythritol kinase
MIKSFAKVNIFLKITGKDGNYHNIFSRFYRVENLFDTLSFEKKEKVDDKFCLDGTFSCTTEENLIYKSYLNLYEYTKNQKIKDFFQNYKIVVNKNIPEFAGLGGGSSNCAAFLNLLNKELNLSLSTEELINITNPLGSDIAFFIHDIISANVSGRGTIVEPFEDNVLNIKTTTPNIKCSTPKVYQEFRKNFYKEYDNIEYLKNIKSDEYLKNNNIFQANDLYQPALSLYPELLNYQQTNNFFSGSGSSFFEIEK